MTDRFPKSESFFVYNWIKILTHLFIIVNHSTSNVQQSGIHLPISFRTRMCYEFMILWGNNVFMFKLLGTFTDKAILYLNYMFTDHLCFNTINIHLKMFYSYKYRLKRCQQHGFIFNLIFFIIIKYFIDILFSFGPLILIKLLPKIHKKSTILIRPRRLNT